jgi:hypothetical protein
VQSMDLAFLSHAHRQKGQLASHNAPVNNGLGLLGSVHHSPTLQLRRWVFTTFIAVTHGNHVHPQLSCSPTIIAFIRGYCGDPSFSTCFSVSKLIGAPLGSNLFFTPQSPMVITFTHGNRVYLRLSLHLLKNVFLTRFTSFRR